MITIDVEKVQEITFEAVSQIPHKGWQTYLKRHDSQVQKFVKDYIQYLLSDNIFMTTINFPYANVIDRLLEDYIPKQKARNDFKASQAYKSGMESFFNVIDERVL